jgi:hypothetical protein
MEEFRPALEEVVLVYALFSIFAWGLASGAILLLEPPRPFLVPLLQVAGFVCAVYFGVMFARVLWHHLTVRFSVDESYIVKREGWLSKRFSRIRIDNVNEVGVLISFPFSAFDIGSVWIRTFDCRTIWFYNVKDPNRVAEKVRLAGTPGSVLGPRVESLRNRTDHAL